MFEYVLVIVIGALVLAVPTAIFIMAMVALLRTRRIASLEHRIAQLEARIQQQPPAAQVEMSTSQAETSISDEAGVADAEPVLSVDTGPPVAPKPPIQWELLIGQKAFGWIAVALAVFGAAFFLKYAYENSWVGPIGRVAIGVVGGLGLMFAGLRYHRRNWPVIAQMLSACGIVILYLATYSAFGFYELLPSFHAGGFLTAIVLLSAVCAVCYNSPAVALVAILGGLFCPLLLHSEQDSYVALFCYLTALNLGVAAISLVRTWPIVGSVALFGTQMLFWTWYAENYHPEKFSWALVFQLLIYGLYLAQDLAVQLMRRSGNRRETTFRMLANAAFGFGGFYVLMQYDYREWMGVAAVATAAFYMLIAHTTLVVRKQCTMELVTTISIAAGFLVLAIPLEADARWIAVSWAATAATIWWFSLRVEMPALRIVSASIVTAAISRVLFIDLWSYPNDLLYPLLNRIAVPSIGVAAAVLVAVVVSRRYLPRLGLFQRSLIGLAGLGGIALLWLVLTVDVYRYFEMLVTHQVGDRAQMQWLGQMSVSILWTLYASALLAIGFRYNQRLLRWLAIGFFTLTIGKVFLVDMSELSELYRIVAFFILAIFLAIAAMVYQRILPDRDSRDAEDSSHHVLP